MDDELVFYTNPMSRGRIVRWMLEETGLEYRTELMEYGPSMKTPEFLAVNPMGKVPALRHGTTVVTECAAIVAYLAEIAPDAKLAPPVTSVLRGPYYRWLFFAAGPAEAATTNTALGLTVPEGRESTAGYGSLARVLDTMEAAVADCDYLVGDRFTAADLYLASQLGFGMMFGVIEKRPAFERYAGRLMGRPAAVRARGIDDALLPAASAKAG